VISALAENLLAQESELYIYADAAKNTEAQHEVNTLRDYLKDIRGFKTIHIRLRENNLGVDENIIQGVTEVIAERGKAIVLEDDLVTSPWFLTYMNEALNFYENEPKVASIHGYVYPLDPPLKEAFFLKGADCWGWATWKRAWDLFERDGQLLLDQILQRGLQQEFEFEGTYPYLRALAEQAAGNTKEWDIRWYATAFLADMVTLYPGQSLVSNIGHDSSGTHCAASTVYDVELRQTHVNVETAVKPDREAYLAFADFLRNLPSNQASAPKGLLSRSFKKLKTMLRSKGSTKPV